MSDKTNTEKIAAGMGIDPVVALRDTVKRLRLERNNWFAEAERAEEKWEQERLLRVRAEAEVRRETEARQKSEDALVALAKSHERLREKLSVARRVLEAIANGTTNASRNRTARAALDAIDGD